ncbi:hypothetical protein AVEN_186697-1 [Araneus ventricosus]|uniref:Uncharacterized protein n=1 Tax=Araneus ventricosus TaxID=182803 RepID=A0A4Y2MP45_ARAVE|nr:hypothetical protein AVEN_186697-1 [Araneus ventricosus]
MATAHPLPQEVSSDIGVKVTQSHTTTVPTGEARTRVLIQQLLIHVLVVFPGGRVSTEKQPHTHKSTLQADAVLQDCSGNQCASM